MTRWRRRGGMALLVFSVLAAHVAATRWLSDRIAEWNLSNAPPPRLAVAFVREVKPAPPPVVAPAPPARKPPRRKGPRKAALPASAPQAAAAAASAAEPGARPADVDAGKAEAAASGVESAAGTAGTDAATNDPRVAQAAPKVAAASEPATAAEAATASGRATAPDATTASGPATAPDAATAPGPPTTPEGAANTPDAPQWPAAWPASTRLEYSLTGWFRGEVRGDASVEWLRDGAHYQIHLDVSVPPLMRRTMSSDGELRADGLQPRRYDEETRVGFNTTRRTIRFESDTVLLPDGRRLEGWPGVQDAASQFVHLTWLFTTQPQLLAAGQAIEIPLALPRNVDRWRYDVERTDDLVTPFATLPVWHLKPRRVTRPRGDMVVETWIAPTLLYLPVRIRIHPDPDSWVDLMIVRPPLQSN